MKVLELSPISKKAAPELALRLFAFLSSLVIWYLAFTYFKPWAKHWIAPRLAGFSDNPRLLLNHLLVFSLPNTMICAFWWTILAKLNLLPSVSLKANWKKGLLAGLVVGVLISAITFAVAPLIWGFQFGTNPNPWRDAGNFFSNTWEEIQYRGLIYLSAMVLFRNVWVAATISGIIFGWTHDQYPLSMQIYVGLIGATLALAYHWSRNFLAPVLGHDIPDWLIDNLMK